MFEVLQSSFKFSFLFFKDVKNLKYFVPGLLLTFLFYIVFDFKYFGYPSFSWDNIGAYFSFQAYYFLTFILLSPFLSQLSNDINEKEFGIVTPFSFYQLIKDLIRLLFLVLSLFLIQIGLTFGWWLLTFILPDFFSALDVFFDFFPNNKKRVMIITKTNLEIKLALLLKIADAQSKRGNSLREFLIVSLSMSMLNSFSFDIAKSIKIKTLLL